MADKTQELKMGFCSTIDMVEDYIKELIQAHHVVSCSVVPSAAAVEEDHHYGDHTTRSLDYSYTVIAIVEPKDD